MPYPPLRYHSRSAPFPIGRVTGPRPAISERVLDMIPGGLAWLTLLGVVAGAYYAPLPLIWVAALLALYSALRFTLAGVASLAGLLRVQRWAARDWHAEYHRRATANSLALDEVHHVVLIPNYQEDEALLRRTLDRLARQAARVSMSVVLAMEGREPGAQHKAARLKAGFEGRFKHFFVVSHPKGIPGELPCKSANQSWAARWVRRMLVDELGYNPNHLLVTSMDADTMWHPRYFEGLGVLFATHAARYTTYWQAPIRYHGNVWRINPLMRILHAYSTAWEMAYLSAPWWQALPMSSYSMSMRLLENVGFWDPDVIADEWHMYIKSYFQHDDPVQLEPVFLPFWSNATTGQGMWGALRERYLQTLRHAWGAKEIGYTLAQINEHPQRGGLRLLLRVAHDNVLAGAGWVVMMVGAQLPILFHPDLVRSHLHSPPFILLQISITLITLLTMVFWALDLRLRPPRERRWSRRERLYELASLPLLAIITFVCVTLPVLHAQTRLLLGKSLVFRVSLKT